MKRSRLKNVTLSADENLIQQARLIAVTEHKTLNAVFREWLEYFVKSKSKSKSFEEVMEDLASVQSGRHFTREELNAR